MITATTWVPRGFAAPFPKKYVFDEDEYERIAELAKLQLDDAKEDLEEAHNEEKQKKEKKGKSDGVAGGVGGGAGDSKDHEYETVGKLLVSSANVTLER